MSERGVVNQAIRDVLDATDLTDAREIAARVIDDLNLQDPVEILMEVMAPYVRRIMIDHRRSIAAEIRERDTMSTSVKPTSSPSEPRTSSSASPKWRQAAAIFNARHAATAGTKLLGKFNRDDILAAIRHHKMQAAGHFDSGQRFEKLLTKLDEYGVELVEDLPVAVVEEIFR